MTIREQSRHGGGAKLVRHAAYRLFAVDVRDREAMRQRLRGNHMAVVHLAARAGVSTSLLDPLGYRDVHVRGTDNLLELAKELRSSQFAFASSGSVYGANPNLPWREEEHAVLLISPYASSKLSGELLGDVFSHLYGMRFVALRFFTVYSPRQRPDLAVHKFGRRILDLLRYEAKTPFGDGIAEFAGWMKPHDRTMPAEARVSGCVRT